MKKRRIFNPSGPFGAIILAVVVLTAPATADAAEMVGHKAIYSVQPGTFESASDFTGVSGNMELVLENDCTGWTMSQTLQMNLQLANGGELRQFHRFTGRESRDGTRYDFFSSSRVGNNREDFRGRAIMEGPGGPGNVVFRIPEGKKIPLPEGAKFPLGHMTFLIDRAQAGERLAAAIVFDGADDGGAQEVTAFIGRKQLARDVIGEDRVKALGALVEGSGWNIRMAFYKLEAQAAVPEYEVEALQLDNGVTPWLLLDYHDFSVVLKMNKLEEIPLPKC